MGQSLDEFIQAIAKRNGPKTCKKTNKYGGEVVRVNQIARTKLQQMADITKIPKRSLLSYAVAMLHDEFEKWRQGNQDSNFGYEVITEENQDAKHK